MIEDRLDRLENQVEILKEMIDVALSQSSSFSFVDSLTLEELDRKWRNSKRSDLR